MPNQIKLLRERKGWSMHQLAEAVSPPTTAAQINKLEKGQRQLTYKWITRLAKALNVNPYEITGDIMTAAPGFDDLNKKEKGIIAQYRNLREKDQQAFLTLLDTLSTFEKKRKKS